MGLESESGEVTIPVEESTGEIKIANDWTRSYRRKNYCCRSKYVRSGCRTGTLIALIVKTNKKNRQETR